MPSRHRTLTLSLLAASLLVAGVTILSGATVTLTWQDNANNEDKFRVYRAVGAGAFAPLAEPPASTAPVGAVVTFVDTTAAAGTTYNYRVSALNTAGESAFSNTATVTTAPAVTVPGAASGLAVEVAGDLINVSTRGQVTATDSTIIPGFVVSNGRVRVLVRLVGPTLGAPPFNVPGTCADPVLTVRNSAGAVVASNDDWSGAAVSDAATATGAFSLPAGSKDAALVIILPPGNYTVVARSTGGDGIGLAEVYKVP